jgi:DnaJ-domain-containing protein 1
MRMRKPAAEHSAIKPRLRAAVSDNEPKKLVCAGLALALVALALRIASVW